MAEPGPQQKAMLGNNGYDAAAIFGDLEARGIEQVIPPKRVVQRPIDDPFYAMRNRVEPYFSKPEHSRRLATR